MKKLSEALDKSSKINKIYAKDFDSALNEAYNNPIYKFIQNSELLDVKDRFRIFEYEGKIYLSKLMTRKKSVIEIDNSMKAYEMLNGKKINNFTIEIVEPRLYNSFENSYVVTEYKGNTLQECLYTNTKSAFSFDDLKKMIKLFSELGIEYPGFCSRNMVVTNDKIYLFDFENAKFYEKINYYNLLYKTNILINWSYFFDDKSLVRFLDLLSEDILEEPELNSYEKSYKEIIGFNSSDFDLRKNIMNVVLNAEKKINDTSNDYCLLPIDLASIISDLYDFNVDAIMDMTFYAIRKKDETIYENIVYEFSKKIISAYKNNENLSGELLPLLLYSIGLDLDCNSCNLLNYYYLKDKDKFYFELKNSLFKIFKTVYSDFTETNFDVEKLSNYFLELNNKFDKNKIKCYSSPNFIKGG